MVVDDVLAKVIDGRLVARRQAGNYVITTQRHRASLRDNNNSATNLTAETGVVLYFNTFELVAKIVAH